MPPEGRHIRLKKPSKSNACSICHFESIIKQKTDKAGDKSEINSEHEACGFGYQVVRYDGKTEKPVIYRAERAHKCGVVEVFLNHLECAVSNINIFAHPKPLIMIEQNIKDYENATKCWICEQEIAPAAKQQQRNPKVRDHSLFTDEYRGAAHKSCNLKLKIQPQMI